MEGNINNIDNVRDVSELYVVEDPLHVQKLFARESGDPAIDLEHCSRPALKIQKEYSNDERL